MLIELKINTGLELEMSTGRAGPRTYGPKRAEICRKFSTIFGMKSSKFEI